MISTQVPTISFIQIPALSTAQLPEVSPNQIPALIPVQVALVNSDKMSALHMTQIPDLLPVQVPSINPAQVPALASAQLPLVTPDVVPAVNANLVPSLNTAQISSVSPGQVPNLAAIQIPAVFTAQVPTLTQSQIPVASPMQIPYASPVQVPSASPAQVPTLSPNQVPAELPKQIPANAPALVPTLSPSQVPASSPAQTEIGLPTQIPINSPVQVPTASPEQVPTLSPSQVPALTMTQMRLTSQNQIPAQMPIQIPALAMLQLPALKDIQFAGLSPAQIPLLAALLIPHLNVRQVPVVTNSQVPVVLALQVPALSPAQVPSTLPRQVPAASLEQVPTIIPAQVPASASKQLSALTDEQLPILYTDEVPLLNSTVPQFPAPPAPQSLPASLVSKTVDLDHLTPNVGLAIQGIVAGGKFGVKVATCDLNGDGHKDIVLGIAEAPVGDLNEAGLVYIILSGGRLIAAVNLYNLNINQNVIVLNGKEAQAHFGSTVACLTDINGDGLDDLAVAAVDASPANITEAGEVYVFYGNKRWPRIVPRVVNASSIDGLIGFVVPGVEPEAGFGTAIASIKNHNRTNQNAFMIGVPDSNVGGIQRQTHRQYDTSDSSLSYGQVILLFGQPHFPQSVDFNDAGLLINGVEMGGRLGAALASNDVNGDTFPDLLIGAPGLGSTYAVLSNDRSIADTTIQLSTTNKKRILNIADSSGNFAGAAVGTGDINGDGIADIIIGAPNFLSISNDNQIGRLCIIWGQRQFPDRIGLSPLLIANGFCTTGIIDGQFGSSISVGDFNHDTFDDIASGAITATVRTFTEAGKMFLILGRCKFPPPFSLDSPDRVGITPMQIQVQKAHVGNSLALGDVNRDGVDDVIVCGALPNMTTSDQICWILFGKASQDLVEYANEHCLTDISSRSMLDKAIDYIKYIAPVVGVCGSIAGVAFGLVKLLRDSSNTTKVTPDESKTDAENTVETIQNGAKAALQAPTSPELQYNQNQPDASGTQPDISAIVRSVVQALAETHPQSDRTLLTDGREQGPVQQPQQGQPLTTNGNELGAYVYSASHCQTIFGNKFRPRSKF